MSGHPPTAPRGQVPRSVAMSRMSSAKPEADLPAAAVPVPVLEALASAWEDQAAQTAKLASSAKCAGTLADCARMMREAITKGTVPKGEK